MKAMILAAGRGERMRPLSDNLAKPLLKVKGKSLIVYQIEALVKAGITDIVINLSYQGEQIQQSLGDGTRFGAHIAYSHEGDSALGTGGGIKRALTLLGSEPFLLLAGDIWTDYPYQQLITKTASLAHLVLVPNPVFHPVGDFGLTAAGLVTDDDSKLTYACIAVLNPGLFDCCNGEVFALGDVLRHAIANNEVYGELYKGAWDNVGTPEQLRQLDS